MKTNTGNVLCIFYGGPKDGYECRTEPRKKLTFTDGPNRVIAVYDRNGSIVSPAFYQFRGFETFDQQ